MRESVPGACTPFPCPSQTVTIGSLNVIHVLTFKLKNRYRDKPVADPGGGRGGHGPPGPVKISHKKDGHRRRPYRFHVSRPPLYPAAGSATANSW